MPTVRFVPQAVQERDTFLRPWSGLSNLLGDSDAYASRGTGSDVFMRALDLGAWRAQSGGATIAATIPEAALISDMSVRVELRSSGAANGTLGWYIPASSYWWLAKSALDAAAASAFSWRVFAAAENINIGFQGLRAETAVASIDLQMAAAANTLDLRRIYLDITYAVPRHLLIDGVKPAAISLGATPIAEAWFNGIQVWP